MREGTKENKTINHKRANLESDANTQHKINMKPESFPMRKSH